MSSPTYLQLLTLFFTWFPTLKSTYRHYENSVLVAAKAKNRVQFLKRCLEEQVLPTSCRPPNVLPGEPFPLSSRLLLKDVIRQARFEQDEAFFKCRKRIRDLRCHGLEEHWISTLTDIAHFAVGPRNNDHKTSFERKLQKLIDVSPWSRYSLTSSITNLSKHILTLCQSQVLGLGLTFSVGPDKKSAVKFINSIDSFNSRPDCLEFFHGAFLPVLSTIFRQEPFLPLRFVKALNELKHLKDIHITKQDKGGGIVLMNKSDYIKKMESLLDDNITYKKLKTNPLEKMQSHFNSGLKKLSEKLEDPISLSKFKSYLPKLPYAYGLPKTHKNGHPVRPIISSIGSPTYRLAKHLSGIISPFIGSFSTANIKHSSDLIQKLGKIDPSFHKLVSFDVESLFTNVPLEPTLDFIQRKFTEIQHKINLPVEVLVGAIRLCVSSNYFSFNGGFYLQKFGIAMGSPLSPLLANFFLEMVESEHLCNYSHSLPKFWGRYVDDVLAIIPDDFDLPDFLAFINSFFPSLKFTIEMEKDKTIPFLDILIERLGNSFKFRVYRKPSNSNSYLHFFSYHTFTIKVAVAQGIFLRAFRISDRSYLSEEISFIFGCFTKLGYPRFVLDRALHLAKRSFYCPKSPLTNTTAHISKTLMVPFHKDLEDKKQIFKHLNLSLSFNFQNKLSNILVHNKDVNEVCGTYVIPCLSCNLSYIGETGTNINKRMKQHIYDVKNWHVNQYSGPVNHFITTGHKLDYTKAQLIFKSNNRRERRIVESSVIKHTDNVNLNHGFFPVNDCISSIIVNSLKIPDFVFPPEPK